MHAGELTDTMNVGNRNEHYSHVVNPSRFAQARRAGAARAGAARLQSASSGHAPGLAGRSDADSRNHQLSAGLHQAAGAPGDRGEGQQRRAAAGHRRARSDHLHHRQRSVHPRHRERRRRRDQRHRADHRRARVRCAISTCRPTARRSCSRCACRSIRKCRIPIPSSRTGRSTNTTPATKTVTQLTNDDITAVTTSARTTCRTAESCSPRPASSPPNRYCSTRAARSTRRVTDNRQQFIFLLHVMNGDGTDMHQISFNTNHDFAPSVLSNGQIVFSRWEVDQRRGSDQPVSRQPRRHRARAATMAPTATPPAPTSPAPTTTSFSS